MSPLLCYKPIIGSGLKPHSEIVRIRQISTRASTMSIFLITVTKNAPQTLLGCGVYIYTLFEFVHVFECFFVLSGVFLNLPPYV